MHVKKNQTQTTKSICKSFILWPCVITVQSHFCADGWTCSSHVAHLYYFKLYVSFSVYFYWVDHVFILIISWCSLSKKSLQTNLPHHKHFCIAFAYLLMFCHFFLMLNNQVAPSKNTALFRFLIFSDILCERNDCWVILDI